MSEDREYQTGLYGDNIRIKVPEPSGWACYLFGGNSERGIVYRPAKGEVPNFFWRWMQYLCFGNRWKKEQNRREMERRKQEANNE